MTIEIRQLVIRAIVDATGASDEVGPARPAAPDEARPRPLGSTSTSAPIDRDALVAACVREVLRELRRSTER
jgi:hypothetical protein